MCTMCSFYLMLFEYLSVIVYENVFFVKNLLRKKIMFDVLSCFEIKFAKPVRLLLNSPQSTL